MRRGEKNNGFDVLYHNMKFGLSASKEFAEFVRERSNIEENNSKLLTKLAKQAGSCCSQGTFAPLWQVLKASAEKLSSLHFQTMQKLADLVKEVGKYADDLHKKHKSVKEEESGTLDVVQAMQNVTLNVQKSKDVYNQRFLELERLRKESTSAKDIEKAEQKLKKAQEDYKNFIEKYSTIKEDFEKKMSLSVKNFQDLEVSHLVNMKKFLNSFADVVEWTHDEMGKVHKEFRQQCLELTIDQLLEQFVKNKSTGLERPGIMDIDEPVISPNQESEPTSAKSSKREGNGHSDQTVPTHAKTSRRTTSLLNLFMSNSQGSRESRAGPCSAPSSPTSPEGGQQLTRHSQRGSKWFLRSRRDKAKQKKSKKKQAKDSIDNQSNKEEKSDAEEKDDSQKSDRVVMPVSTGNQEVDEDGYVIRPTVAHAWNEKSSFYSSSDSDTDDDRERKIHVEIKPLNNGSAPISASVDELRATVGNIYLTPTGSFGFRGQNLDGDTIKRSQSVSQQLGKPSSDLLGLNFVQSPTASNASTPTSSHPYAPLQSPSQLALNSPTLSVGSKYTELGDLFSEDNELPQPPTKQPSRQTSTPTSGYMSIPRPPSRRSEANRGLMQQQSSSITRADSINSLEFRTACVPVGVSRGPSPLTIGMADTIPLAVAFHEIVHTYFRGADESRCQVKMSGEMMLSFPAGIVTILANNPNPAKLIFRVKNTQRLSSVLPNTQLVSLDPAQSSTEYIGVEFNMNALSSLLKKQSEQNPSASYFNVDILKYQIKSKPGANSCPLQLVAYWKCTNLHTDLKIDYKYNLHAMSSPTPLLNVNVAVPIEGSLKNIQSKPQAQWPTENNRILWKYTELSQHSENNGVGSMLARYDVENGSGSPSTISAQFNCEGTTLSGIDFQLVGAGYRLSLVKRRFVSGKYICDGDRIYGSGTATPNASTLSSAPEPNC
ncbi:F-BAR domain only protein 1 isoform X2 [Sitophilus oryzae]|uniref:F-BAR domain only protein 1 isoform X2 n=1 Tax=Sitophilus oryzae TaxID=7048 RepID=A0A6J2XPS3_SITOR|nr:F-BAR domain only protein 1 isoform X2 [Sitophilus oryzae]